MTTFLRPGSTLTHEELRDQVRRALEESSTTQRTVAQTLGVDESSVSRACVEAGSKFQRLQCKILEELLAVQIERRVHFVVTRA
jgi:predicted XRE-type DNA-binding protein